MDDAQKKIIEYQALDGKIKEFKQQLELIDNQMLEVAATMQSVDEFSNMNEEKEILVPLNNGIFAKATLHKQEKLRVNVGAGVVVDKSFDDTKKLIEKQKKELDQVRATIMGGIQQLVERASAIEKDLKNV